MINPKNIEEMLGKLGLEGISEDLGRITEEIKEMESYGYAGGDMVKVTVVGGRRLKGIALSKEAFADREILEDLIVSATNSAFERAEEDAKQRMSERLPSSIISAFTQGSER